MIQVYSTNITAAANEAIPLNNVTLKKGCTAQLNGVSAIQLNNRGVYMVECDGFCTPTAAGDVTVQLFKNGVAEPQAISSFTGIAGDIGNFGFQCLVQVNENNSNCCCSSPTILQFMNGETAIEGAHINVCVTKLC